jgi:hypothetical protein
LFRNSARKLQLSIVTLHVANIEHKAVATQLRDYAAASLNEKDTHTSLYAWILAFALLAA